MLPSLSSNHKKASLPVLLSGRLVTVPSQSRLEQEMHTLGEKKFLVLDHHVGFFDVAMDHGLLMHEFKGPKALLENLLPPLLVHLDSLLHGTRFECLEVTTMVNLVRKINHNFPRLGPTWRILELSLRLSHIPR